MITPLLSKPREAGGTLYTFPSAQRDLAKVFANDSYTFRFSHFACLDFPDIKPIISGSESEYGQKKFVDLDNTFPDYTTAGKSYNTVLAEHLQNYVMNFETAILNGDGDDDDYDKTTLRSVSERVFFNWFTKVGGIELKMSDNEYGVFYETAGGIDYNTNDNSRHADYVKNRTVKYIGNIDIINSVELKGDVYTEVYLHIPSTVGASYEVRFRALNDKNYSSKKYTLNSEKIIGWDETKSEDVTPFGLSNDAIYDYDTETDNSDGLYNTYTGDDGYMIDFRDSFYRNTTLGYNDVMTMNELSPDDFEFNCVLIYYNLTDKNTRETATNLYGVLFLEEVSQEGAGQNVASYIKRYPKHKTTNLNSGNSFAMKIDIKVDAYPVSSISGVYENANYDLLEKLQEYMDDMVKLQQTIDIFNRQQTEIATLQARVSELESMLYGMDSVRNVSERVGYLESVMSLSADANPDAVTGLINEVSGRLDNFIENHDELTSINNIGYGISVSRSGDLITIDSNASQYSINNVMEMKNSGGELVPDDDNEITSENSMNIHRTDQNQRLCIYTALEEGNNLCIIYVDGETCTNNIELFIDDSAVKWKNGQTLKIKFRDYIDFNGFDLIINTGLDNGRWKQTITRSGEGIPYTPTIEMVCVDSVMNSSNPEGKFIFDCFDSPADSGKEETEEESSITSEQIDSMLDEILETL